MDPWSSNKLPERLPFSKKRLPKRVIFSYIADYLIIIILIGVFTLVDKIAPFHQPFALANYTLHYPYAVHERIPVFHLLLISVAFPALVIGIYTLVIDGLFSHQTPMPAGRTGIKRLSGRYRLKDRLWELNCGILGLGLSVGAAFTITGALKNAIGKPRPDLIDRCKVKPDIKGDPIDPPNFMLSTIAICTQTDDYILQDGFKSFPSGHSSAAFAGLFYLSLYLAAKLHVMDAKGEVWRTFIVMVPTLSAAIVAGTRIMDARHHPFDVLSGAALGLLTAWGSYRQYFPPISETWRKGRAYPIRAWGRGPQPPPQPPTIMIDEDTQPLRPMYKPGDEERGASSSFQTEPQGGNVFRQQISDSQRRRQDEGQYGVERSDTGASSYRSNTMESNYRSDTMGSTMSSKAANYRNQMPAASPFASHAPRNNRMDNYDYSSSEDDDNYELQQTYTLSAPQNGVYNPVSGTMTNTGYHPPTGISPTPTPPPPGAPKPQTGDLGERSNPPPHAVGTAPQQI